jgi:hypothetical protein
VASTGHPSREKTDDYDRRNTFDVIRVYVGDFDTCPLQAPSHDRIREP